MAFLTAFITFNVFHAEKPYKRYEGSVDEIVRTRKENLKIIDENIASSQRAFYISLGMGIVAFLCVPRITKRMKKEV